MPQVNGGFLARAHQGFFYLGLAYCAFIGLVCVPSLQRIVMYQHYFRLPLYPNFDTPETYGLAPGKAINLQISSTDNVTLGAWFILSDRYYHQNLRVQQSGIPPLDNGTIRDALQTQPTILYFHGTAGTRASASRVQYYSAFTNRLQANVLVIDYRGFGDSSGVPSEPGLEADAVNAWRWLLEAGAKEDNILITGHSLGTAVATKMAKHVLGAGHNPRGLALLAPFTSIAVVIEDYPPFGFPIFKPLQSFALGRAFMKRFVRETFNTLSIIQDIELPVFVAHATSDTEIPHRHSRTLIDHIMHPILPPSLEFSSAPGQPLSEAEFTAYREALAKRHEARALLVQKTEVPKFGIVEEFYVKSHKVTYVETHWGAHNLVGLQEGVQDEIAKKFSLGAWSEN
ncbi:alpha/beta-hydrolase [Panus rudis PR-1116 ss-1]|nr:alpha/beta-hydrolase [Panus rudis PR-1116 ss-1]